MLAAIIAVFAVIADQISKYIVVQNIELRGEAGFINGFMSFYHTRNTGAAFSMLSDHPWIFIVFSIAASAIIIYLLVKEYRRHVLMNVSLAMILGGGIGNLIDRIFLGYVVDFLRFDFVNFAIFNVADCFITVGAVLLAVYIIFFDRKVEKRLALEAAEATESEDTKEEVPQEEKSDNE